MPKAKLAHHLHLHLLVFIAGFTGILGHLISLNALPLVWYRMLFAVGMMLIYAKWRKLSLSLDFKQALRLSLAGVVIALHWVTFFSSIKAANISVALATFSAGAFFGALLEPLIFKRKIYWAELLFGVLVVWGVSVIVQNEFKHLHGIILGLCSAFFGALFSVINGKLMERHSPVVISFYEFLGGVTFLTLFLLAFGGKTEKISFGLSWTDLFYLFILASVCTAYCFIAAVGLMKYFSPFTLLLSYNIEPIYGVAIGLWLFPENEQMSPQFYFGALIILFAVVFNGVLKKKNTGRNKTSHLQ